MSLVGLYARYTICWCSEVYVDILLCPTGLIIYILHIRSLTSCIKCLYNVCYNNYVNVS